MMATARPPAVGLRLVSASAGSGKTTRLTEEVTRAVNAESAAGIDVEGLLAVTYTTKAHAELETRIRRSLVTGAAFERAQRLPLALVGTVHAVCLRLLKEFALDAGLSPVIDVIPASEGRRLLQAALEHGLPRTHRERLDELGRRFQLEFDARTRRVDWVLPVDEIMTLARSNRIPAAELPNMARRSIDGFTALLPVADRSGGLLEQNLATAIHDAIHAIERLGDDTKKTRDALAELRQCARRLERGQLTWCDWAKLTELEPAKRAGPLVASVQEAAAAFERHPEFRSGWCELTELLFEAARIGLVTYAAWKAERGLLDYVDMIDRALDVLDIPDVASELRAQLQLVVVDEFQDTSPIQLAFFTRLHALCNKSVWVGDRKQCIFEYAGADPALMEAVTTWSEKNGGSREFLEYNYRSRPELVGPISALFSAAFAEHGYTPDEVVTSAKRAPLDRLDRLPAFGVWWLEGKQQPALAEGVVRLLQHPSATPVLDRTSGDVRDLRASDIAVLVYSNTEAERLSVALQARGIATVLPRTGLLVTPEGTLVTAALRLLVDRFDTLAAAEIEALLGYPTAPSDEGDVGEPCERWLSQRIRLQAASDKPLDLPFSALDPLREQLVALSPSETLDRVLAILDVPALAVRWPDPQQRLANLEALRALAAGYEERCSYQREAASIAGMLRYFEQTQQKIRSRDDERATDEQHVARDAGAVVISTYHKAKGLEWPVVILSSLHRPEKRDAFDVTAESDGSAFDADRPLADRWIRYWPWPLGGQRRSAPLAERAANSSAGMTIAEREARERVRLLYVGCTRARDHLILGVQLLKKGPSKAWLDELRDARGPLLTLPEPGAPEPHLAIRGLDGRVTAPVLAWSLQGGEEPAEAPNCDETRWWFAKTRPEPVDAPRYWIAPSRAAEEQLPLPTARVVSCRRFTRRMPFVTPKGITFDQVGSALHAFLAADYFELTAAERTALATRVLRNAALDGCFDPDVVIGASDALRTFVAERWQTAMWRREVPVTAVVESQHGRRRIEGAIDLLLETPHGSVIVDHKSFPGRASEWEQRALSYAPQLMAYAAAIEMAGRTVIGRFVHFTVGGGIVEIGAA